VTTTFPVVPIEREDWRAVKDLRLRALADSPQSFGSSLDREIAFGPEDWRALVDRGRWFRAVAGDASIGIAAGLPLHPDEAHLASFWVEPASRGTGVATALPEAVVEWARSSGVGTLTLWVGDESPAARRFYTRMGFAGTGRRQPLPSDARIGEELMSIDLTGG
jgi:GNAT superfamily N-acetyltransferase